MQSIFNFYLLTTSSFKWHKNLQRKSCLSHPGQYDLQHLEVVRDDFFCLKYFLSDKSHQVLNFCWQKLKFELSIKRH